MSRRPFAAVFAALFLCLACSTAAFSQSSPDVEQLKKDVEQLKNVQKAIIMELRSIRSQMPRGEEQPAAEQVDLTVNIEGAPKIGSSQAKIAVVEFSDFECPYCGRHFEATLPSIEKDYVDTGKVIYVLRDFPLAKIHPHAMKAAEAANCAADQNKFWEMHAMLFSNQQNLEPNDLVQYATGLHLDKDKFEHCLSSDQHAASIAQEIAYGGTLGVNATPTFFVGRVQGDAVKAVARISGAYPYSVFKDVIDSLLNSPT